MQGIDLLLYLEGVLFEFGKALSNPGGRDCVNLCKNKINFQMNLHPVWIQTHPGATPHWGRACGRRFYRRAN
jgi:hypothetical protein